MGEVIGNIIYLLGILETIAIGFGIYLVVSLVLAFIVEAIKVFILGE